ncbi:MAG: hypothetical protein IJS08_18725, partial [Victivallales bacterium]|nr:hypothetical protein [Victivallales bacterium]
AQVADVFSSPKDADVVVSFSKCSVKPLVSSRKVEGRQCIVCYNGDKKNVEANFTVDDCDVARRLLDGSTINVGGTSFRDTLKPGQLKIYRLEKLFE